MDVGSLRTSSGRCLLQSMASLSKSSKSPVRREDSVKAKLASARNEVRLSLRYCQDVVLKCMLDQLPGSTTILLDNVLRLHVLVNNLCHGTHSREIYAYNATLYAAAADLADWSNRMVLSQTAQQSTDTVNKLQLAVDSMVEFVSLHVLPATAAGAAANGRLPVHGKSLPDLTTIPPLTAHASSLRQLQPPLSSAPVAAAAATPGALPGGRACDQPAAAARDGTTSRRKSAGAGAGDRSRERSSCRRARSRCHTADTNSPPSVSPPPLPPKSYRKFRTLGGSVSRTGGGDVTLPMAGSVQRSAHCHQQLQLHHQQLSRHQLSLPDRSSTSLDTVANSTDLESCGDVNGSSLGNMSLRSFTINGSSGAASGYGGWGGGGSDCASGALSEALSDTSLPTVSLDQYGNWSAAPATVTESATPPPLPLALSPAALSSRPQPAPLSGALLPVRPANISVLTDQLRGLSAAAGGTGAASGVACGGQVAPAPQPRAQQRWDAASQVGDNDVIIVYSRASFSPRRRSNDSRHRTAVSTNSCNQQQQQQQQLMEDGWSDEVDRPPPLPVKRKHVLSYMAMLGDRGDANNPDFFTQSMRYYNQASVRLSPSLQQQQQQQQQPAAGSCGHTAQVSYGAICARDIDGLVPPALPPKSRAVSAAARTAHHSAPPLPPPHLTPPTTATAAGSCGGDDASVTGRSLPSSSTSSASTVSLHSGETAQEASPGSPADARTWHRHSHQHYHAHNSRMNSDSATGDATGAAVENGDSDSGLVMADSAEDGCSPSLRGGSVEALVNYAVKQNTNDFSFQEAFLCTYRTFMSPRQLLDGLMERYGRFYRHTSVENQCLAKNAFSLLVRVVDQLSVPDVSAKLLLRLMHFEVCMLRCGDLLLARLLRIKLLEKYAVKQRSDQPVSDQLPAQLHTDGGDAPSRLLGCSSLLLARQMTLLDWRLFACTDTSELLLWARDQREECAPNLTTFTEHFNKMSYWARSVVLTAPDARHRARLTLKFCKIMKHLRKLNNFNSFLALLSALDSAPLRRLERQKTVVDLLRDYSSLIDSSGSFRAYRLALAAAKPPCIPYIGLILQDLTFVHIGNADNIGDNCVNFVKRWQQYNILNTMKRFKQTSYDIQPDEKVIAFFNDFNDHLSEEDMWKLSETIKPRASSRK